MSQIPGPSVGADLRLSCRYILDAARWADYKEAHRLAECMPGRE